MADNIQAAQDFRDRIFKRLPQLMEKGECRVPNQRFWDFYHPNKSLFYAACIGVRKTEDDWIIVAHEFVDREAERQREIEAMLRKHPTLCKGCFQPNAIERSFMQNQRVLYRYFCKRCSRFNSAALPHKLVTYCLEELSIERFDRPENYPKVYWGG